MAIKNIALAILGGFLFASGALALHKLLCSKNSIWHQLEQMLPGKGINPMLTQQAVPQKKTKEINKEKTLADALAIH